ncbi:MAG: ABC transporter substrate-binding protein [Phreatobacter sp.]|uniref:ABC transporter substrate-binding protein n=1 Tax=Phreatobacter sp. TaxID=1966341 RepID=UPI001A5F0AA4|nr:ABC transporter substrate-binding protein [Phreatobacter sp.]MBL8571272.1 ABC transporter substrate-binding protein [Phreatobacter sp.]
MISLAKGLVIAGGLAVALMAAESRAQDVKIGLLYDATGPVAAQSVPYARGIQAAVRAINSAGGIGGKQITLLAEDYGYQIPRALAAYRKLKAAGVIAIQGFGSGDTEALMDTVARDRMPWFSASYSAHLADPQRAPYNYFAGADYSAQARAGLKHIADNWTDTTRRPRLAIVYMDNAFGKSVLPAIQSYADELKIEIVGREVVNPGAIDAVAPVSRLKDLKPDFIWLQQIASTVAVIIRDSHKAGFTPKFYGGVWTYDPNLIDLAGPGIEGMVTVQLAALTARGLPVATAMAAAADNPAQLDDPNFLRGWASMIALATAMKAADRAGSLTGQAIKTALDSGTPIEVDGLMEPLVFTARDHRSSDVTLLYRIEARKPVPLGTVRLERRPSWLGH